MTTEIHLTKKDFILEWYSGGGGGGQHRNKHENCCRIRHKETGLTAIGTASKSRKVNQETAFHNLALRILSQLDAPNPRNTSGERVRTYHAERNTVLDHASGLHMRYTEVVDKGNIGPMVEARRGVMQCGI